MALTKAQQAAAHVLLAEAEGIQLSHRDICATLSDALRDLYPGQYCYIMDVFGDDESGDVVFCTGGMESETLKAPYTITMDGETRKATIDAAAAVDVLPRTVYDEEAPEEIPAEEAERFPGSKDHLALAERFISKSERDAADADSFAGKDRSFPILRKSDVMAAVRSIGRGVAGGQSASSLKSKIIAIAKRKGWSNALPKAWQGDSKESKQASPVAGEMVLCESAETLERIVIKEARADYEIKLIAPGKGSSAFYPKEVLQRDGPKVFKAGTHVYLNHPTAAEEAARPEGDVKNLAGVLATDAVYHESHAKGPGLYARMKVFADHAQVVEEKAPHVGMSIRASGVAESGKTQNGVPILKELVSAESVDVVTRAGAGGMILTEAARPNQEVELTLEEAQKLIDKAVAEATAPLREANIRATAREEAGALLKDVTLPEVSKRRITEAVLQNVPTKDGAFDAEKFRESVIAASKAEGDYLSAVTGGSGRVIGMGGSGGATTADPKKLAEAKEEAKARQESDIAVFESLGMPKDAAVAAAKGRAA
jgi:hypothetical protein